MTERCFWCNVDPDAAAARHEGPHLKWCLHYRHEPLPAGVKRVTVGGITTIVMESPLMLSDEICVSRGPRPEQNVVVIGIAQDSP